VSLAKRIREALPSRRITDGRFLHIHATGFVGIIPSATYYHVEQSADEIDQSLHSPKSLFGVIWKRIDLRRQDQLEHMCLSDHYALPFNLRGCVSD
jgi:hypothetical protein